MGMGDQRHAPAALPLGKTAITISYGWAPRTLLQNDKESHKTNISVKLYEG